MNVCFEVESKEDAKKKLEILEKIDSRLKWKTGGSPSDFTPKGDYIYITARKLISYGDSSGFDGAKLLSFGEVVDELITTPKQLEFKLNNQYTARITKNIVTVGCQTFNIDSIREIVRLHDNL